jgi:acyl carrier protein
MTTREQVREFVNRELLKADRDRKGVRIQDNTSMIKSGLIDSMSVVELVAYVENTFQINVADHDINIDDFDSIDSICSLIARREART